MRKILWFLACTTLLFGCSPSHRESAQSRRSLPLSPNAVTVGTGSIAGVVTDATNSNAPVGGVLVTALKFEIIGGQVGIGSSPVVYHAITTASGAYTLTGMDDGSYVVMCRPALTHVTDGANSPYPDRPIYPQFTTLVPQWNDGTELTSTNGRNAALAGGAVISGGNAVSGVNFPLHRNVAEASGDVHYEFSHGPAVGMHIQASTFFGVGNMLTIVTSVCLTDASGHFRIAGLPNSGEVFEEDIESPDPALPGLDQRAAHGSPGPFHGDNMYTNIQTELRPWVLKPDNIYVPVGADEDDPEDASLGAADVTHITVSQAMNDLNLHLTGCDGWVAQGRHEFRVDVTSREPLSTQSKYRLRLLLTDNLSLNYQEKQIQTTLLDDTGELGRGNSQNGAGSTPPNMTIYPASDETGYAANVMQGQTNFWKTYGFHTTGPALGTDPDPLGDVAEPGVSKLSWMFNLASLGPLKGSGTGFYIYVETIGVKGGGGLQDVAPNDINPKTPKPLLVKVAPDDFKLAFCGKIGVI